MLKCWTTVICTYFLTGCATSIRCQDLTTTYQCYKHRCNIQLRCPATEFSDSQSVWRPRNSELMLAGIKVFFSNPKTGAGVHPACYQMCVGGEGVLFLGGKSSRVVKLSGLLQLMSSKSEWSWGHCTSKPALTPFWRGCEVSTETTYAFVFTLCCSCCWWCNGRTRYRSIEALSRAQGCCFTTCPCRTESLVPAPHVWSVRTCLRKF